jgi:two-component system response regulator VanR
MKKDFNINSLDDSLYKENTVLVVEDDETVLDLLKLYLKNFFHKILLFKSAEEAEKYMRKHKNEKIHTIIADYYLPNKHGSTLASFVKKYLKNKPKFILSSGDIDSIESDYNLENIDHYLLKPYSFDKLKKCIGGFHE